MILSNKKRINQRAELLAEETLLDLQAKSIFRVGGIESAPFDLIAVFSSKKKGMNLIPVEVRATEKPIGEKYTFLMNKKHLEGLINANVPVLFVIVNTKLNEVYLGLASDIVTRSSDTTSALTCSLPVAKTDDAKRVFAKSLTE